MPDRQFFDTNVLVYAYDSADPAKQEHARQIIRNGIAEETAVLSAQVLGKFFTGGDFTHTGYNSDKGVGSVSELTLTLAECLPLDTISM